VSPDADASRVPPSSAPVAAVLIALGALARLRAANAAFLAPDEALHRKMAGAPSLAEVYRGSLGNAHPPLFVLLLHGWMRVARTDWALRLLPVLLGVLALVAAWSWTRRLVGANAGLLALALLSLLPSIVLVSSELRGYALLLATSTAALAMLERGLDERSPAALAGFGIFGVLALLSHYAAFRVVAAAVAYSAVRLFPAPRARRLVAAWAVSCAALAGVGAFLLRTHASKLRGGPLEAEVRSTWLAEAYFRGGGVRDAAAFLERQTLSLLHYLFSATAPGLVALAFYAAALVLLLRERRPAWLLLALPPALAAAGGLLALYPYGGTRHDVDVALFLTAGTALGFSRATGERRWVTLAAAAALAPAAFLAAG
jgi:hypothetical protein